MPSCKQVDNSRVSVEVNAHRIVTHANTTNQPDTIMTNDLVNTQEASGMRKLVSKVNYQKTILRIVFLTLSVVVLFVNFHFLIFFDLEVNLKNASFIFGQEQPRFKFNDKETFLDTKCSPRKNFDIYRDFMDDWWFTVDIFFTFIIPFLTMSFTFVFIGLKLRNLIIIQINHL